MAGQDGRSWEPLAGRLLELIERLRGPFSIVIWAPEQKALYCARDKLGRRSLVVARTVTGDICLSSVPAPPAELWNELPVTGLLVFNLAAAERPAMPIFHGVKSNHLCQHGGGQH